MASWKQAADSLVALLAPWVQGINSGYKVYEGWPTPEQLRQDLANCATPAIHVTVFPRPETRNSTRYSKVPTTILQAPTETATTSTTGPITITLGGALTVGDNIFSIVNGYAVGVGVGQSSTLDTLASQMANGISAITPGVTASAVGATITLTGTVSSLSAQSFGQAQTLIEALRIQQLFQISIWANNPLTRQTVEDKILSELSNVDFLTFADTSMGRIVYMHDFTSDEGAAVGVYRKDTMWEVEYPVFKTGTATVIGHTDLTLVPITAPTIPPIISETSSGTVIILPNSGIMHDHIWYERPTGPRPGTSFTLAVTPRNQGVEIILNNIPQVRVASAPGLGEFTLSGTTITMGTSVGTSDSLVANYEI